MPQRIQRKRTKGWRMPPGAIYVGRPGRFGNPYFPGCGLGFGNVTADGRLADWPLRTPADMVRHFREHMAYLRKHELLRYGTMMLELRGHDLACWCKVGEPCHADVLLELANK